MDFMMEFLFGLLFEAPAEAVMGSKRVKTSVKTTLFLLLGLSLSALFGIMAFSVNDHGDNLTGALVIGLICICWTAFVIWGAVSGHKRKWKKD